MSPTPPPPSPSPSSPQPTPNARFGRGAAVLDPSSLELALMTLQQRLDQLQESLAQQNKLATLGMITAVIAHEFNNILTPMIAYTKFALTEKADDALRTKALTKALAGSEKLANISKSLLGFARGDESARANVAGAVRETLACLSRDLSKDGIALTLDVAEDLHVSMNGGHFQQVLMNLIVNARSAMLAPMGGGIGGGGGSGGGESRSRAAVEATRRGPGIKRLTIRAAVVGGATGRRVELRVADTGPGIPAEVLPRIFDPFFSTKRGARPAKETVPAAAAEACGAADGSEECVPRGGTGLGLTICQELIAAAGGAIRAESEPGKGATFVIELPLAAGGDEKAAGASST